MKNKMDQTQDFETPSLPAGRPGLPAGRQVSRPGPAITL